MKRQWNTALLHALFGLSTGFRLHNLWWQRDCWWRDFCWGAIDQSLCVLSKLKNHRMAWVEKDHNDHLVSTSLLCAGSPTTRPGLECLQGWGIHNLLGQPVPVCHHPVCEKLLPNIQPKSPLSQSKTIPPCPITIHPCKQTLPYCLYAPCIGKPQ